MPQSVVRSLIVILSIFLCRNNFFKDASSASLVVFDIFFSLLFYNLSNSASSVSGIRSHRVSCCCALGRYCGFPDVSINTDIRALSCQNPRRRKICRLRGQKNKYFSCRGIPLYNYPSRKVRILSNTFILNSSYACLVIPAETSAQNTCGCSARLSSPIAPFVSHTK